jgi:hypothetical protein
VPLLPRVTQRDEGRLRVAVHQVDGSPGLLDHRRQHAALVTLADLTELVARRAGLLAFVDGQHDLDVRGQ